GRKGGGGGGGGCRKGVVGLRRRGPPAIVPPLLSFTAGFIDSFTVLALFGLFVAQVTGLAVVRPRGHRARCQELRDPVSQRAGVPALHHQQRARPRRCPPGSARRSRTGRPWP